MIKHIPNQKKSDADVSGMPLPYRILRQWLYAPGTIDGYTFYRQSKSIDIETREPTSESQNIIKSSAKYTQFLAGVSG